MRMTILAMFILAATMPTWAASQPPVHLADATAQDALGPVQHADIVARLHARVATMLRAGTIAQVAKSATLAVDLAWPLQLAPGFNPFGYHGVSNFVDHGPAYPGVLEDYTCGARTYNLADGYNHAGTDYFLWPFPWLMMDAGDVRIIAAAPGVIIEKDDGNFDRDCALDATGSFNAVFVRQDDGLTAWYLHMKSGSLTTAPVGSRVATGDFLGLVGSSGSSTGPHLHFELTDADGNVVDPLHGQCNAAPDRWIVPQPYEAPRIDTLSTHSAEPSGISCGVANGQSVDEQPDYKDQFMPGDTLWAFASYSDQRNGEITQFSIMRPDGSTFAQWSFDLASENLPRPFYAGAGWDWSYVLPVDAPAGAWTLQATFEGVTYQHVFAVGSGMTLNRDGLTGSWANLQTLGQGVEMDVERDFYGSGVGLFFGGWFTYDTSAAGGVRWYTIQGQVHDGEVAATLPIYLTQDGAFGSAQATTTTVVGQATLGFSDCMHGTLQYRFSAGSGRSGSMPLTRMLANVDCTPAGETDSAGSAYLLSGGWADLGNSGQGLVFDRNPQQQVLFAGWYTFAANASQDAGGAGQRWYTLQAVPTPSASVIADIGIYATSGGVFDSATPVTTVQVGTARLDYHSCNSATLAWSFSSGENAGRSGTLELVRLGATPVGCSLDTPSQRR